MPITETIIKEFRLLWGIAPPTSLKGKKGADIESFLKSALTRIRQATLDEVIEEVEGIVEFQVESVDHAGRKMLWDGIINKRALINNLKQKK